MACQEPTTRGPADRKGDRPHAQNPNLHAQDGLFTLHLVSLAGKLHGPVDCLTLDALAEKSLADIDRSFDDYRYFYRVRLPCSHTDHLMWLLAVEGVSAATIYPGFKGVVLALQEERTRGR